MLRYIKIFMFPCCISKLNEIQFYNILVLLHQDETIAAGFIVGLGGQQPENNDPKLENTGFAAEIPELPSSFDPDFSEDIKGTKYLWDFFVEIHVKLFIFVHI